MKKITSILSILLAILTSLFFLSNLKPIFPLIISILLFFIAVISFSKSANWKNICLIILNITCLFYVFFPFKIIFIENTAYQNLFEKNSNSIAITSFFYGGSSSEDLIKIYNNGYMPGGDIVSLFDPKYAILIR